MHLILIVYSTSRFNRVKHILHTLGCNVNSLPTQISDHTSPICLRVYKDIYGVGVTYDGLNYYNKYYKDATYYDTELSHQM